MSSKQARTRQNSRKKCNDSTKRKRQNNNTDDNRGVVRIQDDLLSPDYILRKLFRKDGPPLGVEFDSVPSHAFHFCKGKDSRKSHRACHENQRALKRRKVSKPTMLEDQTNNQDSASVKKHGIGKGLMTVWRLHNQESVPVKKHGMGKGLMTVWRLANPGSGDLPSGVDCGHRAIARIPAPISAKPPAQGKKKTLRLQQPVTRRLGPKAQDRKKPSARSRKVRCQQIEKPKQPQREKCELSLDGGRCEEDLDQFSLLVDDEELELRELQEGSNPLTCCAHFTTSGLHGCSLCKDLLAKFPPNSVTMKRPLRMQPCDSSPELAKKLFKIFHFLCTYAGTIGVFSFTLDEFAQAFYDKDSLLLGKVNVALLKLLFSDVEMELCSGILSHVSKNCKYRGLLQSVEHQDSVLKLWKESLNSLTWIEILRQVFVAAGFGSKHGISIREPFNKEANLMAKYGLSPGTLKGELFTILSLQGNIGLKVSELANFSPIVDLKLAATTAEIELLINSMLSSDITLFEKISSSAYRLRSNSFLKDSENEHSDLEDGNVDDDTEDGSKYSNADDSEDDSGATISKNPGRKDHHRSKNNMLTVDTEIDESHPGEAWLLGLMEGEYSDLNIEEKLNALLALIDLLSAGSSIRMEEPATSIEQCVPIIYHGGSGAKIKRSTAKQNSMPMPFGNNCRQTININEVNTGQVLHPVDSSAPISKIQGTKSSNRENDATEIEVMDELHPMQSIYLGSDRRYNRYWLFLGPCTAFDPGHKRIYFESSEDGHWEVIDTEEAFCTLLSALDRRGRRERHLLSSLEKRGALLCQAMSSMLDDATVGQPAQSDESERSISREDSCSAVSDVDNLLGVTEMQHGIPASTGAIVTQIGNREQQKQKWSRLQGFDAWLRSSFYSALNAVKHGRRSYLDSLVRCERCHDLYWRDEKHCKICHTTFELDFDLEERYAIHAATCRESSDLNMFPKHKVLSSWLQSLKAAVYAIESSMPEDAMVGAWTKSAHNLWVKRLRRTSTLVELLQVLADFVGAINEEWLYQCNAALGPSSVLEEIIASFSAMPQTSSAVALWLVKLDALIAPHLKKVDLEKTTDLGTRSKGKHAPLL